MFDNSLLISVRRFTRYIGLNSVIANLLSPDIYESKFSDYMLSLLRDGDIVWDVGAHVGFYSSLFCLSVGHLGHVYCFEPNANCLPNLQALAAANPQMHIITSALGGSTGFSDFVVSDDSTTCKVTSQLSTTSANQVYVVTSDDFLNTEPKALPNFIKIDTEGFEYQIVSGMPSLLHNEKLRCIAIEVHFRELELRGEVDKVSVIINMLRNAGFSIKWIDFSHLVALRDNA